MLNTAGRFMTIKKGAAMKKIGEQFVYIRYFAVRNEKNQYLGTLEVTQNIKHIQEITGEKRLVSD